MFTLVGDPVAEGIIQELAHPGGNITGVSGLSTELVSKDEIDGSRQGFGRGGQGFEVPAGADFKLLLLGRPA